MLLEAEDLWVSYAPGVFALRGVSFQLDAGEMVAVLGANGAGKSTLLRALSGLVPLAKGRLLMNGRDLARVSASERVAMGIVHVPEGRQMLTGLSVEENIRMGGYVQRRRKEFLARTEERVYALFPVLRDRRTQLAGSLSGGQQQMVAIGRALMADPKVMMCDEPSLGLAPLIVTDILKCIAGLRDEGVPVLLVEQNARKALAIADKGVVLKRGEILMRGGAAQLLHDPDVAAAYLGGKL
jgi:branched-chain amino acid transport system ATP-binding protein